MMDVEHRRLLVEVLLARVERIVADLRMDGEPDVREAVRRLMTEPVETLGAYACPMRTLRTLAEGHDPAMVERGLADAFDLVLALT